jgi:hypothetical protein
MESRPTTPVFPANQPEESPMLAEIQARRSALGKWRGKTPTGKVLPGGRKRRSKTKKAKKTARRRRVTRRS